jgi:hypothetical protein
MGPDGLWKLCDFGSTSTNHKRFEKAMRWVFRKITSESTLRLLTELQRFFLSLCSSQDLLFVHTLFFSLVFVIDLCRL